MSPVAGVNIDEEPLRIPLGGFNEGTDRLGMDLGMGLRLGGGSGLGSSLQYTVSEHYDKEQPAYTKAQKEALIKDLQLELDNWVSRLRAQYQLSATALKSKVESRINRVPKRLWSMTLRDLYDLKQQPLSPLKKPSRIMSSSSSATGRVSKNTNLNRLAVPRLRASPVKVSQIPSKSTNSKSAGKATPRGLKTDLKPLTLPVRRTALSQKNQSVKRTGLGINE